MVELRKFCFRKSASLGSSSVSGAAECSELGIAWDHDHAYARSDRLLLPTSESAISSNCGARDAINEIGFVQCGFAIIPWRDLTPPALISGTNVTKWNSSVLI